MEAALKEDIPAEPVEADVAPAEAPAPAEAEPPSSTERDALDDLLDAYDHSVGNGAAAGDTDDLSDLLAPFNAEQDAADRAAEEQQRTLAWQAGQQRAADESARSAMEIAQRDRLLAEREQTIGQLEQVLAAQQARELQARSLEEFNRICFQEQSLLSDVPGVDDDYFETQLRAAATRDPQLVQAFDTKFYTPPGPVERSRIAAGIQAWGENQARLALNLADPRARQMAEKAIHSQMEQMWAAALPDAQALKAWGNSYLKRAIDNIHKTARKPRVDSDASADRLLVAQAVRGSSAKFDVREPAPAFAEFTDSQLNAWSKQFGFRAI